MTQGFSERCMGGNFGFIEFGSRNVDCGSYCMRKSECRLRKLLHAEVGMSIAEVIACGSRNVDCGSYCMRKSECRLRKFYFGTLLIFHSAFGITTSACIFPFRNPK